jgi:hypothetical protein
MSGFLDAGNVTRRNGNQVPPEITGKLAMRFARAVLWLSVIALAANGLTRNGRQLANLYESREALAQIRKLPSDSSEKEAANYTLTNGTISLRSGNLSNQAIRTSTISAPPQSPSGPLGTATQPPANRQAYAADPAMVEEIIKLRKQIGRTPVADILSAVDLPGDRVVRTGELENDGESEPEELFRAALRQIPAGGLPARSAAISCGSGANAGAGVARKAEFPFAAGGQLPALRLLTDWVWGMPQSTRRMVKQR